METGSNAMRESWKRLLVYNLSAPTKQSNRPSLWGSFIFSGILILLDQHTSASHLSTFFIPWGAVILSGNAAQRVQVSLRTGISDDASVPFQTGTSSFALTRANRLLQLGAILLRAHLRHSIDNVRVGSALRQSVALRGIGRFVLVGRVIFGRYIIVVVGDGGSCRNNNCNLLLLLLLRNNIHRGSTHLVPLPNRLPRSLRIARVFPHLPRDPPRLLLEFAHLLGG
mmetsp:Transcript_16388/g.29604  ORF Transcript_16388/g.29604 Transcript_16388/m.29604 type:complete len:226 (+) Transcript_16388:64-741(+)